jgi:septation ring formation regulator
MIYIFGGIGVLIAFFLTGYFMKRKYFNEVDRYEAWKIELMNRPVLDEMSKVKQLNMTGQTEELFERWRKEWDEIVTVELPGIEELLFDAEEFTDKLRFKKAKEALASIDGKLEVLEERIRKILEELNELVGSEEKNRTEVEELKELYRQSRKTLLAHSHSFGKAEKGLEEQLNGLLEKFQEFDVKTESGDYLEAREILLGIKAGLEDMGVKLEVIPQLLHDCNIGLPAQISELKEGCREMAEQGYALGHLGIEKELEEIGAGLAQIQSGIDDGDVAETRQEMEELKQRIDGLFDLLEKEVEARRFVTVHQGEMREQLILAADASEKIQEEIEAVQQSYHLPNKELEVHSRADELLFELMKRYEVLAGRVLQGEIAYSYLSEELAGLKDEIEDCIAEQKEFKEKLNTLRKDEMSARDSLRELSRKITSSMKLVSKSNLPGLSQNYKYLLEDAKESIQNVSDKLEQKPLDIPTIQQHLEIAELTVEKLANTTAETVENVRLAERVIQYGNRYRSSFPSVDKGLKEAEEHFRNYNYREALEQAAAAIEEVEPGAMKKIDELFLEKQL